MSSINYRRGFSPNPPPLAPNRARDRSVGHANPNGTSVFAGPGFGQRLSVVNDSFVSGGSPPWWGAAWFNFTNFNSTQVVLGSDGWNVNRNGFQLNLKIGGASIPALNGASPWVIVGGTWYFVYFHLDGATLGEVSVNAGVLNGASGLAAGGTAPFVLGGPYPSGPGVDYKGQLDRVWLGTGSLTPTQVSDLYAFDTTLPLPNSLVISLGVVDDWGFKFASNLGEDSVGSRHLTNIGGVTQGTR